MKRWPLVTSFVLFLALCASLAYWALQVLEPPARSVAAAPPPARYVPNLTQAGGLFGGQTRVEVATNYRLQGVVMAGNPAESVAILVADGKPAQAVRVGRDLLPGVTVKEVGRNHVLLSEEGQEKRVELPAELAPQTLAPPVPRPAAARAAPPPPRTAPAVPSTLQRGPAGMPGAAPGNR